MKAPNSTDRFFSERLNSYDAGAPMHLWDAIDKKRTWQHRVWMRAKRNSWLLLLLFLGVGSLSLFTILGNENLTDENISAFRIDLIGNTQSLNNNVANAPLLNEENIEQSVSNNAPQITQNKISDKSLNNKSVTKNSNISNSSNTKNNLFTPPSNDQIVHLNTGAKVTLSEAQNSQTDLVETKTFSNSTDPVTLLSNLNRQNSVAAIANLDLSLLDLADDRDLPDPCFKFSKKDFKQKKIKKQIGPPAFYLDALFSPDYAHRTLTLRGDSDQENYLNARENSEQFRYAYSGGIRGSVVFRNGLALRTGLMYSQINERFDYENGTHIETDIKPIYDNGVIIGHDTTEIAGTLIKTTFNRFHLIDVPVILGFELPFRRFTFSANAGVYFNFFFKKRGEILNQNLVPQSFSPNNEDAFHVFRNSLEMSYFGSFGIHYKWKENWHLLLEPHFRYYPTSFTNADFPMKQNYWTAGVSLGVRYKFDAGR